MTETLQADAPLSAIVTDLRTRAERIPTDYFTAQSTQFALVVGEDDIVISINPGRLEVLNGQSRAIKFRAKIAEHDFDALRTGRSDVMTLLNTGRIVVDTLGNRESDPPLKSLQYAMMLLFSSWYLTDDHVAQIERHHAGYDVQVPLPRVAHDDLSTFRQHAAAGRPMVISGLADTWDIRRRGFDDLLEMGRHVSVSLLTREHGKDGHATYTSSTLRDYIRSIQSLTSGDRNFPYLAANAIPPALERMVGLPPQFPAKSFANTRMWIGPPATGLDFHRDMVDNFLVQVFGQKRISLIAPHHAADMLPQRLGGNPFYHPSGRKLRDEMAVADLLPTTQAARLVVTLNEGDTIYLPAGWWHQVHNETLSWSFNFFAVNQPPVVLGAAE